MKTRIREIRKANRMTQEALAALVGISKSYLSQIESGVRDFNGRRLEAFARVLGVGTQDLLVDSEIGQHEPEAVRNHIRILKSLRPEDQEAIFRIAHALSLNRTTLE